MFSDICRWVCHKWACHITCERLTCDTQVFTCETLTFDARWVCHFHMWDAHFWHSLSVSLSHVRRSLLTLAECVTFTCETLTFDTQYHKWVLQCVQHIVIWCVCWCVCVDTQERETLTCDTQCHKWVSHVRHSLVTHSVTGVCHKWASHITCETLTCDQGVWDTEVSQLCQKRPIYIQRDLHRYSHVRRSCVSQASVSHVKVTHSASVKSERLTCEYLIDECLNVLLEMSCSFYSHVQQHIWVSHTWASHMWVSHMWVCNRSRCTRDLSPIGLE